MNNEQICSVKNVIERIEIGLLLTMIENRKIYDLEIPAGSKWRQAVMFNAIAKYL